MLVGSHITQDRGFISGNSKNDNLILGSCPRFFSFAFFFFFFFFFLMDLTGYRAVGNLSGDRRNETRFRTFVLCFELCYLRISI